MFRKILSALRLFLFGGFGYCLIELLWRKRTHWSMGILGGVVFLSLYFLERRSSGPLWKKGLWAAGLITLYEFLTGCLVNLCLGWAVWDYSAEPFNLLGQICPLYTLLWLLLSLPILLFCRHLNERQAGF